MEFVSKNDNFKTFVDKHVGNNNLQGLKFIKGRAIQFIDDYNQKHNTNWKSYEPDARILVHKCAVHMRVRWADETEIYYSKHPNLKKLDIICDRVVKFNKKYPDTSTWAVSVTTTRPK